MRYLLIIFSCLLTFGAYSQEDRLHLKKQVWQEEIKDLNYDEKIEAPKEEQKVREPADLPDLAWVQYGGYVIVAIVFLIILLLVILKFKPIKTVSTKGRIEAETIEEAEENLPSVMLDKIYQQAINKQDFKAALRIKFLMILQKMIDANMIVWKKRKTNEQYLLEISDINISMPFAVIVNLFDDVWYGEAELTAVQFTDITSNVELLTSKIHSDEG